MTADQRLQDAIIDLQKCDLNTETRHLVDEAAQLLASGRDIEARALVEKAQAVAVPRVPSKANGSMPAQSPITKERMAETIISRLSSRLAQQISSALNDAVEELRGDFDARMHESAAAVESRLGEITSSLQAVSDLQGRVDRMEQEASASATEAQGHSQRLDASITSLQEADQARKTEFDQFSRDVSGEIEKISLRLSSQEETQRVFASLVQEFSSKVLSLTERVEGQTRLVRSIQERHAQKAAALHDVLDGIAKLREAYPLANTAEAG
jgi:hypothetical protein